MSHHLDKLDTYLKLKKEILRIVVERTRTSRKKVKSLSNLENEEMEEVEVIKDGMSIMALVPKTGPYRPAAANRSGQNGGRKRPWKR